MDKITLNNLQIEQLGKISNIHCNSTLKRRLLDLGFINSSKISPKLNSPSNGIRAYQIRNTLIALRDEDASLIEVEII